MIDKRATSTIVNAQSDMKLQKRKKIVGKGPLPLAILLMGSEQYYKI